MRVLLRHPDINRTFSMGNLRYRNARDVADWLGQVFTPQPIASLLAESIPANCLPIRRVLDLGAGKGALTAALLARHKHAKATLVEIDSSYVSILRTLAPKRATVTHADVLDQGWACAQGPDVVVSNPPYGTIAITREAKDMLDLSGLRIPISGNWVRGDAAFVARAWRIAALGSGLGLIVASPIVRDRAYMPLRERLIGELRGLCVTQLHEGTFRNAEVRAFLITGQRAANRCRNVHLRKAMTNGNITDEMTVSYRAAVVSLDIDYHRSLEHLGLTATDRTETLGSVGTVIVRGSRSQRDYERLGLSAFHTTDFSEAADEVILSGASDGFHAAKPGDILIPRVGSRCLVKQTRVRDGSGLFTDCVYRLVVGLRARPRVWKTLSSSFGADWRLANAGGSCAKHLTIQTLLTMPLLA